MSTNEIVIEPLVSEGHHRERFSVLGAAEIPWSTGINLTPRLLEVELEREQGEPWRLRCAHVSGPDEQGIQRRAHFGASSGVLYDSSLHGGVPAWVIDHATAVRRRLNGAPN